MRFTVEKHCLILSMLFIASLPVFAGQETGAQRSSANVIAATYGWADLIQPLGSEASQQQRDSFGAFTEALATEAFPEAEIAAKRMVEQVDASQSGSVEARATALHNLAVAQQFQGNNESALQNYAAAIDIIARDNDMLSPALELPLRGLASAQLELERIDEAFASYERALHVSNVNYGPHSLRQLPILETEMSVHLQRGDPGAALEVLDRIQMLYTRKYPRYSEELLPALYKQAEIYGELKLYADERAVLRRILKIKKKNSTHDDIGLIEPNIKIAENLIRVMRKDEFRSVSTSSAEKHLKTALLIAEQSENADWEIKKDCLLSLADFYTIFDMKGRARRYYAEAWQLLSSDDAYYDTRIESFATPVLLFRPGIDPYANFDYNPGSEEAAQDEYQDGEMTFEFTVDDRGRTQDLRVVAANPSNFSHMEKRARNALEEFVFRPRYSDGVPAAAASQQHTVSYYYLPSEYQASVKKAARSRRN